MANQLGMVAPIAANAGVGFDELNAAMAAMTKSGLSTDIAATSLRGILVAMLKPSKDLVRALGGDPSQVLKKEGLLGVMQKISEAAGGDTKALGKMIPDVRALNGAAILAGKGLGAERAAALLPHKLHPGSRPLSLLAFPRLDPHTLGMLIALYEHKVFVQSVAWDINPFDQWGVELGKKLCNGVLPAVRGQVSVHEAPAAMQGILAWLKRSIDDLNGAES